MEDKELIEAEMKVVEAGLELLKRRSIAQERQMELRLERLKGQLEKLATKEKEEK